MKTIFSCDSRNLGLILHSFSPKGWQASSEDHKVSQRGIVHRFRRTCCGSYFLEVRIILCCLIDGIMPEHQSGRITVN
jgi:hypothetical protein